ncbi:hypothetical protein [Myroides odoratus]|uniref:hypothetical protein n=1 Tax=Myroides odoratus TaxID=256 RepID=UPI00333E34B3
MKNISKSFKILLYFLLVLNIILISIITFMLLSDFKTKIAVERIDVQDKSGKNRIVISNVDHIPNPIINGKTYQRAVTPAGLIFYDKSGDERGGIAITDTEETNINAISFDYQNADAVGILAQDNKNDTYFKAGLIINDKDVSGKPGHNTSRINLLTENGNAALVIKDKQEIPRIIIQVDSLGTPTIETFDSKGNLVWHQ